MQVKIDIKKALTAALAVAAIAAPAAQADGWQYEQRGTATVRQTTDSLDRYLANDRGVGQISDSSDRVTQGPSTDALDRYVANNPQGSHLRDYDAFRVPGNTPVAADAPRGGIEWPTVGLGILAALGLAALGAAGVAAMRSRSGRVAHS